MDKKKRMGEREEKMKQDVLLSSIVTCVTPPLAFRGVTVQREDP
jgi:hypothetical protein